MALLKDIAAGAIQSMAPTPIERYVIDNYILNDSDALMGIIPFTDEAFATSVGNIAFTELIYDLQDVDFRNFGEEYDVNDVTPTTKTYALKMLGGSFTSDRALERAMAAGNTDATNNWVETQIRQKINGIKRSFCKYAIRGNSLINSKQYDGLAVFFANHTGQIAQDFVEPTDGLTYNNAIQYERYLSSLFSKMDAAPNVLITTRIGGKALLQAINSYRNHGTTVVEVGGAKYDTYSNIPIVGLEDDCFPADWLTDGKIPIIAAKFDEYRGLKFVVPKGSPNGAIFDIIRPRYDNGGEGVNGYGVFVRSGGCELMGVLAGFGNPYCAALGFIVPAEPAAETFNVVFTADGAVVDTVTVESGDSVAADDIPAVPTKDDYTGAWYVGETAFTSSTVISADTVVVAVYTET